MQGCDSCDSCSWCARETHSAMQSRVPTPHSRRPAAGPPAAAAAPPPLPALLVARCRWVRPLLRCCVAPWRLDRPFDSRAGTSGRRRCVSGAVTAVLAAVVAEWPLRRCTGVGAARCGGAARAAGAHVRRSPARARAVCGADRSGLGCRLVNVCATNKRSCVLESRSGCRKRPHKAPRASAISRRPLGLHSHIQ